MVQWYDRRPTMDSPGESFERYPCQPAQAIGALAVSPANPNIVWAGTGEAWAIRDLIHDREGVDGS
jgi:hypothetical protein